VKLVVLVVPREARDDTEAALGSVGAYGFTEVPSVYGEGSTGPRFGSRIAPGVSDLIFVAVEDARIGHVRAALATVETRLGRKLHAFLLPAEEI
jgi:hypothetical protein